MESPRGNNPKNDEEFSRGKVMFGNENGQNEGPFGGNFPSLPTTEKKQPSQTEKLPLFKAFNLGGYIKINN